MRKTFYEKIGALFPDDGSNRSACDPSPPPRFHLSSGPKKKGRAAPKKSISIIILRELKIPTRERQNENTLLRTDRQTDGRMTTQTGARLANFNVSFCLFELVKIAICMQPSLLLFSAESLCSDNQRLFEVSRRFDRESMMIFFSFSAVLFLAHESTYIVWFFSLSTAWLLETTQSASLFRAASMSWNEMKLIKLLA